MFALLRLLGLILFLPAMAFWLVIFIVRIFVDVVMFIASGNCDYRHDYDYCDYLDDYMNIFFY